MKDIFIVQNANDEGCVAVGSYNARVPLEGTPYRYNPTATNFQVHSLRSCASPFHSQLQGNSWLSYC